jgi:DNA-3-methyladenine glycosylase II
MNPPKEWTGAKRKQEIMTTPSNDYGRAQRHLARRDAKLKGIIARFGPCTLRYDADRFAGLVRAIIAQQISTKAARSITARLEEVVGSKGVSPRGILALAPEKLRSAGLSGAKARALCDLADKVKRGAVPLDGLHTLDDEAVIDALLPVKGIGRWTAEMFLIFCLGRLDVLPVGDWGFRVAVQRQYDLAEPPPKEHLVEMAEPWRPYRSVATWYFWRCLGAVPQSD